MALEPPLLPQLAKSASELPEGPGWVYEPKWDGFRVIVFKDGDSVFLQSRNKRELNRYFPEVVSAVAALAEKRLVLDGEIVVFSEGTQRFDLLSQRVHPAESRVKKLSAETPATLIAFDLLENDKGSFVQEPFHVRRAELEATLDADWLTPSTTQTDTARGWLAPGYEGVIAKAGDAPYKPGERVGMVKVRRQRTADTVVVGLRLAKDSSGLGSLILALYDDTGELCVVGHSSGFNRKLKKDLLAEVEPYRTHETHMPEPSRFSQLQSPWEKLVPKLVCEVTFDHVTERRIRHGASFQRFRYDKDPYECGLEQLSG
jgi:ATP-dependent DNA ligase